MGLHTTTTRTGLSLAAALLLGTAIVLGQDGKPAPRKASPPPSNGAVFRTTTNFHETSVIVRDKDGKFVPDLTQNDFRVWEDNVPQKISVFLSSIGGRIFGTPATPQAVSADTDGLILPPARVQTDVSGRVFVIFIDDLHFEAADSPRVKDILKLLRDTLVHDNDLVGFVSTGTSAIEMSPTYDYNHKRFDEAIDRVMGSAPTQDDIINNAMTESSEGPTGLRYNAHVAFETAHDMIEQLSQIDDRRKSFIYVSEGYDFNPFTQARYLKIQNEYADMGLNTDGTPLDPSTEPGGANATTSSVPDPTGTQPADPLSDPTYAKRTEFADAELMTEVAELVREAQDGNVAFYAVDPRGLIGGMNEAQNSQAIAYSDWRDTLNMQLSTLKVLSEETGGFCVCEMNDFKSAFQRIDNETSDYYMIGYTSTNPDPTKIRRRVRIEVTRPGVSSLNYENEYMLPRPPKSAIKSIN